jgi:hypothetical protein
LKQLIVLASAAFGKEDSNCETNDSPADNETASVLFSITVKRCHYINEGMMNTEHW